MALSTRLQEAEIRQQSLTVWKKLVRISDTMVVVPIPEFLVKKLHIDEECNWFKVIPTETPQPSFLQTQLSRKLTSVGRGETETMG
jgi:hypothetical protein